MEFASADLTYEAAYKLLIGCVVPRPIAWVSTLSAQGRGNLAPFSSFSFVSSKPPTLLFSIGRRKRDGAAKDTARNIMRDKEFVVNVADLSLIEALHRSSFEFGDEESEIEALGLATLASRMVRPPRLALAPIALECVLYDARIVGEDQTQLVIGEVKHFHVRDDLCRDGKIDSFALNPIARLGGPHYATLGERITFGADGNIVGSGEEKRAESGPDREAR